MQSFPSTFPSPEIRSLKSTPYSTGRVANRLGAGVRSEERSGRRSQGLKIRSESARKYISVQVLEETERQLEGLKSKLLKCSLCMGSGQGRESMDKQQGAKWGGWGMHCSSITKGPKNCKKGTHFLAKRGAGLKETNTQVFGSSACPSPTPHCHRQSSPQQLQACFAFLLLAVLLILGRQFRQDCRSVNGETMW